MRYGGVHRMEEDSISRERTVEDAIKSLSQSAHPAQSVNMSIHKEVLNDLEEKAKKNDWSGIKHMISEIKKLPEALKHVKEYPSLYQKALGEHYTKFSEKF